MDNISQVRSFIDPKCMHQLITAKPQQIHPSRIQTCACNTNYANNKEWLNSFNSKRHVNGVATLSFRMLVFCWAFVHDTLFLAHLTLRQPTVQSKPFGNLTTEQPWLPTAERRQQTPTTEQEATESVMICERREQTPIE